MTGKPATPIGRHRVRTNSRSCLRSGAAGRTMTIMRSLARRHVLIGVGATVAAIATTRSAGAQPSSPTSAGPADPALIEDLVAANRILADQGVLDGYGHVSVRHNAAQDRYLMSRSIAPELVTTADIMEYDQRHHRPALGALEAEGAGQIA